MERLNYIIYSWSEYIRSNKIVGVYLLVLAATLILFSVLGNKKTTAHTDLSRLVSNELNKEQIVPFLLSAFCITFLIIFPLTAVVLMQFQTVFYSYNTLWTMAIVPPVIAFALTFLLVFLYSRLKKPAFITVTILTCVLLILCGNMFKSPKQLLEFDSLHNQISYEDSLPVLERLEEYALSQEYNGSVTVLAPRNITVYTHIYSGKIKTLYGKDMWDTTMTPFTYNEYPEDYHRLYTWINCTESFGSFYHVDEQTPILSYYLYLNKFETIKSVEDAESAAINNEIEGGTVYIDLARQYGIDILVIYTDGVHLDQAALDLIVELENLKVEYISISDTEGYILLIL